MSIVHEILLLFKDSAPEFNIAVERYVMVRSHHDH